MKLLRDDDIIALHTRALAELGGGTPGIRDRGLIASAIGRVNSGFGEKEVYPGIFEKAAALLQGIIYSHPFVDGNKRTAVAAAGDPRGLSLRRSYQRSYFGCCVHLA